MGKCSVQLLLSPVIFGVSPRALVISLLVQSCLASLVAQLVKDLPAMQEIRVLSLGQEKPLEKGMATHSSLLTWRIPWAVWQAIVLEASKSWTRLND